MNHLRISAFAKRVTAILSILTWTVWNVTKDISSKIKYVSKVIEIVLLGMMLTTVLLVTRPLWFPLVTDVCLRYLVAPIIQSMAVSPAWYSITFRMVYVQSNPARILVLLIDVWSAKIDFSCNQMVPVPLKIVYLLTQQNGHVLVVSLDSSWSRHSVLPTTVQNMILKTINVAYVKLGSIWYRIPVCLVIVWVAIN